MQSRSRLVAMTTFAASLLLAPAAAHAESYPWCAHYSDDNGQNCGFVSEAQCKASVFGNGSVCVCNPFYTGTAEPAAGQTKRKRKTSN